MLDLRPDVVIAGKLRLLRPLGHGGMGVVWAARHLALQTDVAVKFIRPERAAERPELVARFEREARTTARIAHPHVVRVMDYGAAPSGVPYLVLELLRGFSLAELLERGGRLSFATARSLVRQIGSALESAHEHGVVHRDIKPHNVFITEGSRGYPLFVKVLDFGVAKMLDVGAVPAGSPALTETGVVIGSAPYMSPEQLEGSKDVDLRSDLWSLAVIAYEALTGTQPFQGGSFVTVGAAVLAGRYRPASELRTDLPASIDDWFAKALCLDPGGRFQSAREMVEAFAPEGAGGVGEEGEIRPGGGSGAGTDPYADTAVSGGAPTAGAVAGETADHAAPAEREASGQASAAGDEGPPPERAERSGGSDLGAAARGGARSAPSTAGGGNPGLENASRARSRSRGRIGWSLVGGGVAALGIVGVVRLSPWKGPVGPASCPAGMALIEGGKFAMGSPEGGETPSDETPQHDVAVKAFCLDVREVTISAYSECEACGRPPATVEIEGLTANARGFWSQFCNPAGAGDHPVNCVDWGQARAYCAEQGKRLPTEAEWELSARGGEARTYPWGFAPPGAELLNVCGAECSRMLTERFEKAGKGPWPGMHAGDDSAPATAPVGRYPAGNTPAGVQDLAGNVWEWTESRYCPYGKDECDDSRRVLRGGGWDTVDSLFVRAAHRRPSAPSARGWSIGFRCAKTL